MRDHAAKPTQHTPRQQQPNARHERRCDNAGSTLSKMIIKEYQKFCGLLRFCVATITRAHVKSSRWRATPLAWRTQQPVRSCSTRRACEFVRSRAQHACAPIAAQSGSCRAQGAQGGANVPWHGRKELSPSWHGQLSGSRASGSRTSAERRGAFGSHAVSQRRRAADSSRNLGSRPPIARPLPARPVPASPTSHTRRRGRNSQRVYIEHRHYHKRSSVRRVAFTPKRYIPFTARRTVAGWASGRVSSLFT